MTTEETYKELNKAFNKTKKELKFESSFEKLDEVFFLKDEALGNGFISDRYDRQLCARIVNTYFSWYNHLHSILMPNPQSIVNMTENQAFDDEEKNNLNLLMNKIMAYISKNNVIGVTKNVKLQGPFIDEGLKFWDEEIKEKLEFVMKKIQKHWEKYSDEKNMD
jgi:gas vesicle protein